MGAPYMGAAPGGQMMAPVGALVPAPQQKKQKRKKGRTPPGPYQTASAYAAPQRMMDPELNEEEDDEYDEEVDYLYEEEQNDDDEF